MTKPPSRTLAVAQARYGSTRLPGKVLLDLSGHPALWHVWDRLRRVPELDQIVVATTAAPEDAALVQAVRGWGGEVFAYPGDVNDLLDRYITCGDAFEADIIVMVDGDCPLLHPPTISRMVDALRGNPKAEYARLDSRSIEGGVAVLRLGAYKKIRELLPRFEEARRASYREHATLCIMERPELFEIVDVPCFPELTRLKHRLWLDTPADYEFLQRVYGALYAPGEIVDLVRVVDLLESRPDLRAINAHVGQKTAAPTAGTVGLRGDPVVAEALARAFAESYGVAARRDGASATLAEIDCERSTEPTVREKTGELRPCFRVGIPGAPAAAAAVREVASALGLPRLRSGYFTVDAAGPDWEDVACPLCGAEDSTPLWTAPASAQVALCDRCGHVYLHHRPGARRLSEAYRAYAQTHPEAMLLDERSPFHVVAARRARAVAELFASAGQPLRHALDVGCGYGHFLRNLPGTAHRVGLEPSAIQAAFMRRHAWADEVWQCAYADFEDFTPSTWPADGFDLVTSFHALEHVPDPHAFVAFCARQLRPGGRLVLAVPDLGSLGCDLIEAHYLGRGFHLHTFHPASLRRLLERAGLEVLTLEPEEPTAALRSSLLAVATRPIASPNPTLAAPGADPRRQAARYFEQLDHALTGIGRAFQQWRAEGRRLAVYGGGVHTAALFDVVGTESVEFVVDDDPSKQGTDIRGVPIVPSTELDHRPCDVLVVSSLASEAALLDRLTAHKIGGKVVGIYRDLVNHGVPAESSIHA